MAVSFGLAPVFVQDTSAQVFLRQGFSASTQTQKIGSMNKSQKLRVQKARDELEGIRSEEDDKLWAMGPGLQASKAGESVQEAIDHLEGAISELDNLL